jgi:hypothetical protein
LPDMRVWAYGSEGGIGEVMPKTLARNASP